MNPLFLIAALSLGASASATTARSVTFKPSDEKWNVTADATGTATTSPDAVTVVLDRYTITANPIYPGTRNMSETIACLAYRKSETDWDVAVCAKPKKHKVKLQPGQSETMNDVVFVLPSKNLPPIENFWLVLRVHLVPVRGAVGFSVSHSQRDIFKQPSTEPTGTGL